MKPALICSHCPNISWAEAVQIAARADSSLELLTEELRHYTDDPDVIAIYILVDIEIPLGHYRVRIRLNLRAFPIDGVVVTVLPKGQEVLIWYIRKDGWGFITATIDDGVIGGWVAGEYLEKG